MSTRHWNRHQLRKQDALGPKYLFRQVWVVGKLNYWGSFRCWKQRLRAHVENAQILFSTDELVKAEKIERALKKNRKEKIKDWEVVGLGNLNLRVLAWTSLKTWKVLFIRVREPSFRKYWRLVTSSEWLAK